MAGPLQVLQQGETMKHLIIALAALTSLTAAAQTGVDAMAIQRARNVANQNNNRSMDPSAYSGAPAATATAAPAATPMTPGQQAYARFQASFFAMNTNSSAEAKQLFASNLAGVAQGTKPSQATTSKLSEHLATAVSEAKLTPSKKTHIAQEVAVVMNSANKTPDQAQTMIKDVQSTLEASGSSGENAAAVAADLQAVANEIQKPAAK